MDQNLTLAAMTLTLTVFLFWRSILLRKKTTVQEKLICDQTETLAELNTKLENHLETADREEQFTKSLQQAEVTTELQKTRSSFVHQPNAKRPPERYGYARSMLQSGMANEDISAALGISGSELAQLHSLSSLRK